MVKTIKITANSDKGKTVILSQVKSFNTTNKATLGATRILMKKIGLNKEIISTEPLVLSVWASPNSPFSMVKNEHFDAEVEKALEKNGATKDDFRIEHTIG